jgi:hypothetical protein
MRNAAIILALIAVTVVVTVGQGYYNWVARSESPFEELGIGLHQYMPAHIQAWGCGRLKDRFGTKTLPPYGCQNASNPRQWR